MPDTPEARGEPHWPTTIDETCCGRCPGTTCYVDYLTGERDA